MSEIKMKRGHAAPVRDAAGVVGLCWVTWGSEEEES
jgi:hypothetical protein